MSVPGRVPFRATKWLEVSIEAADNGLQRFRCGAPAKWKPYRLDQTLQTGALQTALSNDS